MANQPFDLEVINPRERPLSSDIDLISSYGAAAQKELMAQLCQGRSFGVQNPMVPNGSVGFFGVGFRPAAGGSGLQVSLQPGLGYINNSSPAYSVGGVVGLNDLGNYRQISLTAVETINVPAANPSLGRYDLIEVAVSALLTDTTSRDVLNTTTGIFVPSPLAKTLTFNCNGRSTVNGTGPINYKTGTPGASPVAPNPDAGYLPIGQVYVPAAASSFNSGSITDWRRLIYPGGNFQALLDFTLDGVHATASMGSDVSYGIAMIPPGMSAGVVYSTNFAGAPMANLMIWPVATNALGSCLPSVMRRLATGSPSTIGLVSQGVGSFAITPTAQAALNAGGMAIGAGTVVLNIPIAAFALNAAYPGYTSASGAVGYGTVWVMGNNDLAG